MAYRKTERELRRLRGRRDHVVASACEVVQRSGFSGAKAREIAEASGVSVGSLYSGFDSIEGLHAEVFRLLAGRELRRVVGDVRAAPAPAASLAALVRGFGARALGAPCLARALLLEPVAPDIEALRTAYRRSYEDLAAGILREGIDAGEFAAQDIEVSAPALIGAVSASLVRPLDPARREPPAAAGRAGVPDRPPGTEVIEEILRLCLRAAGASPQASAAVTGNPTAAGCAPPDTASPASERNNDDEARRASGDDQTSSRPAGDAS